MLSLDATVHILWLGTPVAACVSGACVLTAIGGSSWLTSEERIPNPSYRNGSSKVEYLTKCTVSGLFTLCATEVGKTEFRCSKIDYFPSETYSPDPHDSTTAIPYTVLKSVGYFLTAAVLLGVAEVLCLNGHCCRRRRFFTFVSGIIFVVAGLVMMLGVVIYIATLKGEVGDKLRPRSSFQPPRFTYSYGWCFLLLMLGFVTTETAGITAIFLYIYWHKREWQQKCQQSLMVGAPPRPLIHGPHTLTCRAPRPPSSPRSGGHYMLEYSLDPQHRDSLHHNHVPNHYTPTTHHLNQLPPNPHRYDNHVNRQEGRQHRQQRQDRQQHRQDSGRSQKVALHNASDSLDRRSASCLPVRRSSRRRSSWSSDDAPPAPLVPPAPPPATSFSERPRGGRSLTDLHKDVCWDRVLTSGGGGSLPRSQKLSRSLPRGASLCVSWSSDVQDRPMSAPSAGGTVPKAAFRDGGVPSRGESMVGGTLSRSVSLERGALTRRSSVEGGTLPRGFTIEGGTLPRGISIEGGTLPRGISIEGGTLPRGTSIDGGTLPRGISIEGGLLARSAPVQDPRRYNSLPRGATFNRTRGELPHPQRLLSTAGETPCPACCTCCDSCYYCCCCCYAEEGAGGDPRAPAPCNLTRPAAGGRYNTSFPWPSMTCPHGGTSPTHPRLPCSSPCSSPPHHLPTTHSSHSPHPHHYPQPYQQCYQQHQRQYYQHPRAGEGELQHMEGGGHGGGVGEGGHSPLPHHRRTTPV
ncbi:uncharacterized protein LOC121879757 [Homarus americanus]|uniref:uncharacterized protein LOC121879757 n=1 Tax=Homarus americanus TaxID=6706 RepID=UPI001C468F5A|nr:uncharacterized protein LOC121879757 [Homarus americanus]